jgi:hypothetical protein
LFARDLVALLRSDLDVGTQFSKLVVDLSKTSCFRERRASFVEPLDRGIFRLQVEQAIEDGGLDGGWHERQITPPTP